jgi:hypothetical protein
VVARVAAYAAGPGAAGRVALVPSPADAHADAVFPQPPLALPPGAPRNLLALPNPATLRVNELVVGVATPDVLKHLAGQARAWPRPHPRLPGCAAWVEAEIAERLCAGRLQELGLNIVVRITCAAHARGAVPTGAVAAPECWETTSASLHCR